MIKLLCALFDTEPRQLVSGHDNRIQEIATPDKVERKGGKYQLEIDVLVAEFGYDISGLRIEVELQRLLQIIPRKRRRVDAYQGLQSELKNKLGCELIIHSRKTK